VGRPRTGAEWQEHKANRQHEARQRAADAMRKLAPVMARFREEHGWQPGYEWDAAAGSYRPPNLAAALKASLEASATKRKRRAKPHDCHDHDPCTFTAGSLYCTSDPCANPHHRLSPSQQQSQPRKRRTAR
jgi:hypothetical protein